MNVYEGRSTVFDNVKKWSNECDIVIELWTDKLLIWCQKCCIWSWYDQIHWRLFWCQTVAFNLKAIKWETVNVQIAAFDCDEIKCTDEFFFMSKLLHLILKSLNALTKLSDCQIAAFDRETIKCTLTIVCCESSLIRRFSRWNVENCIWCWNRRMH